MQLFGDFHIMQLFLSCFVKKSTEFLEIIPAAGKNIMIGHDLSCIRAESSTRVLCPSASHWIQLIGFGRLPFLHVF